MSEPMTDDYHAQGYRALPGLMPAEVTRQFVAQLQSDLAAAGRPLASFATRGPLLAKEAAEVYGHLYHPILGMLYGLTPTVAQAVGRPVLPTYGYFRVYGQGDICRIHVDRPACEHSLSLTLAASDEQPWALEVGGTHVAVPDGRVTDTFGSEPAGAVSMRPGDAVLYQGLHRRHGRTTPNPNRWSAHLFLHWVARDGRYAAEAFDRPMQARVAAQAAQGAGRRGP